MIICSCNVISDHDIKNAVQKLQKDKPDTLITIGRVYKALGKKTQCGVCLDNAIQVMINKIPSKNV